MARRKSIPALCAVLAVAAATVSTSGAAPSPTFRQLLAAGVPIYCGGGTKPYVALTFDDGPGPFASQLVDLLRANGQRATFFEIGRKVVRKPGLVRKEASVGAIGDHSFTHPNLIKLPSARIKSELARTQKAIRRITKRKVVLFRPPFGDNAQQILRVARRLGMLEVMWNQDSGDASEASTPSSQEIYQNLVDRVRAGGIVLLHEDEVVPRTLDALRMFLPVLEQEGLRSVTVPELLRLDPPPLEQVAKGSGGCNSSWHP
jgi:peptidoglycan/xylan/chitin deacetylase (PgdA/CDA1 family)